MTSGYGSIRDGQDPAALNNSLVSAPDWHIRVSSDGNHCSRGGSRNLGRGGGGGGGCRRGMCPHPARSAEALSNIAILIMKK